MKIVGKHKNLASFKIVGYLGGAAPQPFREAPIAVPQSKTSVGREEGVCSSDQPSLHSYIYIYIDTLVTGLEAPTNDTACSNGICTPSEDELLKASSTSKYVFLLLLKSRCI